MTRTIAINCFERAASSYAPIIALAILFAMACGAGTASREIPSPTLGDTRDSEEIFRPLLRRWVLGTATERQAVDGRLRAFCQRFEGDDLVRFALVLRAWNALERGELERALQLAKGEKRPTLRSPLYGPAGTTRDLATLVSGAVDRRRGKPHRALGQLKPLLHKMIDGFATSMLDEELVEAALGAHAWSEAVEFMEAWRQEAEPGSERYVEARIAESLTRIPKLDLLAALTARGPSAAEGDMARDLAQQLAVIAVNERDISLARQLVEKYKALLGRYGEAVARLAVDTTRGTVTEKTVGVLLSLRTSAMQRRSVEVTAGMAYGLRGGDDARLVSRAAGDDPEDVWRAMAELAGDGAAVIVAGADPQQSAPVARYAADNSLPVVLLSPDPSGQADMSPLIFLLGEDPQKTTRALADALRASGAKVVAGMGAPTSAVDGAGGVALERPCETGVNELRGEGVDAVVAFDGAYCGDGLITLAQGLHARVGVGLGVPELAVPSSAIVLKTGIFPIDPDAPDARIVDWLNEGRQPPSWWAALARDAAVLAYEAVIDLKVLGNEDAEGVKGLRLDAALGLARADVVLWTSDASGFGKTQSMARKIEIVTGADVGR